MPPKRYDNLNEGSKPEKLETPLSLEFPPLRGLMFLINYKFNIIIISRINQVVHKMLGKRL